MKLSSPAAERKRQLGLLGVALRNLERRGHVIVSAIEHHAVLEPAETLRDLALQWIRRASAATEYSMPLKSSVAASRHAARFGHGGEQRSRHGAAD
jgi:hypothetical protein